MTKPDDADWLTFLETCRTLGISRGTVNSLRRDSTADFPKPIPMGIRNLRWRRSEIEAYKEHGRHWRAAVVFG
jgi:predicted DNA-binding transcriptional regulator AlpA